MVHVGPKGLEFLVNLCAPVDPVDRTDLERHVGRTDQTGLVYLHPKDPTDQTGLADHLPLAIQVRPWVQYQESLVFLCDPSFRAYLVHRVRQVAQPGPSFHVDT